MKTEPTLEGFKAFVERQDLDCAINHSTWAECAIGEYAATLGQRPSYVADWLYCQDEWLWTIINYACDERPSTYGELLEELKCRV